MRVRFLAGIYALLTLSSLSYAGTQEYLVRFRNADVNSSQQFLQRNGGQLQLISREGNLYKWTSAQTYDFTWDASVSYVQSNHPIHLMVNPSIAAQREALVQVLRRKKKKPVDDGNGDDGNNGDDPQPFADNPPIQAVPDQASGPDPLLSQQWGMPFIGADQAWDSTNAGQDIIVAVTDSGIDYNHEDLVAAVWHNPNEIPDNGIDDDKNGYVDDVIGWDFADNDNKPYDLSASLMDIVLKGANPGHGTHVSGVIGARRNNALGISGVAPNCRIMPLRFINETGQGDDAAAVKAIDYAVKMGAKIINASWGGEQGSEDDTALKEAIQRAQSAGVIFVAAAGNGRQNAKTGTDAGYDNDTDSKPEVPASYPYPNIVSVAAIDDTGKLGSFSNWGEKSVMVGAPGVKIMSTVPGSRYQDTIIDEDGMTATWDGTSMAAPFVSGALAVIWSQDPSQTMDEVIEKLRDNAVAIPGLQGKVASGGHVDLKFLVQ